MQAFAGSMGLAGHFCSPPMTHFSMCSIQAVCQYNRKLSKLKLPGKFQFCFAYTPSHFGINYFILKKSFKWSGSKKVCLFSSLSADVLLMQYFCSNNKLHFYLLHLILNLHLFLPLETFMFSHSFSQQHLAARGVAKLLLAFKMCELELCVRSSL